MEFAPKDIMELTGLNRQCLAELDKHKIISPSSKKGSKNYKLYDEKQLDDLCIISIILKCNKTINDIDKIIKENNVKDLYELLDIIKSEAEDIIETITNIQIVGSKMLTKTFHSLSKTSLHDIAERYRKYQRNLTKGVEHIIEENNSSEEYFDEIFEKEFKEVIDCFVKAKKNNSKNEIKVALKVMYDFFKSFSNDDPVKYMVSEAYALQGGGFESEYVDTLANDNISNYISDAILNEYMPKLDEEIVECFNGIDITKDKYDDKKTKIAIKNMISCFEKYIMFDDFTQKGNQIFNMLNMTKLREKKSTKYQDFIIEALKVYNKEKGEKDNG